MVAQEMQCGLLPKSGKSTTHQYNTHPVAELIANCTAVTVWAPGIAFGSWGVEVTALIKAVETCSVDRTLVSCRRTRLLYMYGVHIMLSEFRVACQFSWFWTLTHGYSSPTASQVRISEHATIVRRQQTC